MPPGVIRPTLAACSVNQMFPSGPAAIPFGRESESSANSVMSPAVVIRPMRFASDSANHNWPSGPAAIPARPARSGGNRELGERPRRRHAANAIGAGHREPEVSIRSGRDRVGQTREWNREHRDRSRGRDPPDGRRKPRREPEIAVGTSGNARRLCYPDRKRKEVGDRSVRVHSPDRVLSDRKPHGSVRAEGDALPGGYVEILDLLRGRSRHGEGRGEDGEGESTESEPDGFQCHVLLLRREPSVGP